jgi:hypothetical protein
VFLNSESEEFADGRSTSKGKTESTCRPILQRSDNRHRITLCQSISHFALPSLSLAPYAESRLGRLGVSGCVRWCARIAGR